MRHPCAVTLALLVFSCRALAAPAEPCRVQIDAPPDRSNDVARINAELVNAGFTQQNDPTVLVCVQVILDATGALARSRFGDGSLLERRIEDTDPDALAVKVAEHLWAARYAGDHAPAVVAPVPAAASDAIGFDVGVGAQTFQLVGPTAAAVMLEGAWRVRDPVVVGVAVDGTPFPQLFAQGGHSAKLALVHAAATVGAQLQLGAGFSVTPALALGVMGIAGAGRAADGATTSGVWPLMAVSPGVRVGWAYDAHVSVFARARLDVLPQPLRVQLAGVEQTQVGPVAAQLACGIGITL